MNQNRTITAVAGLASLRRARRPFARLALAVMILPVWLSLMASLSPAAAAVLGQKPGAVGVICTAGSLAQIGDTDADPLAKLDCAACHMAGCAMCPAVAPVAALADQPDLERLQSLKAQDIADRAFGHDPLLDGQPRAPPFS